MKKRLLLLLVFGFFYGLFAKPGLENYGNTCFMNAAFQALYAVEPLREFVIEWGADLYADPVIARLAGLFAEMKADNKKVLEPKALVNAIWGEKFVEKQQADSQELINDIIQRLRGEAPVEVGEFIEKRLIDPIYPVIQEVTHHGARMSSKVNLELFYPVTIPVGGEGLPIDALMAVSLNPEIRENVLPNDINSFKYAVGEQLKAKYVLNYAAIQEVFDKNKGVLEDNKYLQIWDNLENVKIAGMFGLFFAGTSRQKQQDIQELLDTVTQMFRYSVTTQQFFKKLSRYVFIQLKIFRNSGKIITPVKVPTMEMVLTGKDGIQYTYKLKAIIIHWGTSINSGHYYTYTRSGNQWYLCEDRTVTAFTWTQVKQRLTQQKETPYLLFYERIDQERDEPAPKKPTVPEPEEVRIDSILAGLEALSYDIAELARLRGG